jgi:hypothetical protein
MDKIIINTEQETFTSQQYNDVEVKNNMDGNQWIDYQLSQGEYISGKGLVNVLKKHFSTNIIGCEIGVCLGVTSEYLLSEIKNLTKLYCVDNYPTYTDWTGVIMNDVKQNAMKEHAFNRLKKFNERVEFVYESSVDFSKKNPEKTLDFIFIDGDHSYDGAFRDFQNYFPLIKDGGIFAGHDFTLKDVNLALRNFLGKRINEVIPLENNAWYLIK